MITKIETTLFQYKVQESIVVKKKNIVCNIQKGKLTLKNMKIACVKNLNMLKHIFPYFTIELSVILNLRKCDIIC
jgi:hypothetical protein